MSTSMARPYLTNEYGTPTNQVRSRMSGRATNIYQLIVPGSRMGRTPNTTGGARAALDALLDMPEATMAHLYRDGKFVAGVRRDGTIWRP